VCKNRVCRHKRCKRCFFLSTDNERVLYCGGTEYKANTNKDPEYVPPVRGYERHGFQLLDTNFYY
jgi:hypothetical protein